MSNVFKIILFYFFLNANTYAETTIFHKKNDDGSRYFDIQFVFSSKHDVRKNFNLLTDYLKIHRFNPSVYETEIISRDGDERTVLKTTFRNCVHFFCREMIMYESILSYCVKDEKPYCLINAEVLPNKESPVSSGKTSWIIKENQGQGSEISYKSKFIADIFLPPVFGESIFKKTINRNLLHLEESLNNFSY
tara:strand:- start:435 stop:1010 length:576 start_codon:yes stop_codon:yes gene_type:complete